MRAIVAGTFDPPTIAHLDLIKRAWELFDNVTVLVAVNPAKSTFLIPPETRVWLLKQCIPNLDARVWQGLLADFKVPDEGCVLVRGLRTVSDFESEMVQAHVNEDLGLPTVLLPTTATASYVSSSIVRQFIQFKALERAQAYLPTPVYEYLRGFGAGVS